VRICISNSGEGPKTRRIESKIPQNQQQQPGVCACVRESARASVCVYLYSRNQIGSVCKGGANVYKYIYMQKHLIIYA